MTIREITTPSGKVRYRFVTDTGAGPERKQITRTFDTRDEAERQLAALRAARKQWAEPAGETLITDLFMDGRCHPMCVFAWGSESTECICACRGRFHGKLSEMRCTWAYLDIAPVRAEKPRVQRKAISPEMLDRVAELAVEARSRPTYRWQPAVYVVERLAAEGIEVERRQVTNWLSRLRLAGRIEGTR